MVHISPNNATTHRLSRWDTKAVLACKTGHDPTCKCPICIAQRAATEKLKLWFDAKLRASLRDSRDSLPALLGSAAS